MHGKTRCFFWQPADTAASPMTAAAMADRQPWNGNEMDTFSDDLAALVQKLDLKNAIHVGHSIGGGEVARYIGRHGTKRVAKAMLIAAVTPLMLKTVANPAGLPIEAFDKIRAGVLADRSQFFKDLTVPFYGANRPNVKASQGLRDLFWLQGMLASYKGVIDCSKAFFETDFTEDLKKSTSRHLSCTATTTRSCRSAPQQCHHP